MCGELIDAIREQNDAVLVIFIFKKTVVGLFYTLLYPSSWAQILSKELISKIKEQCDRLVI